MNVLDPGMRVRCVEGSGVSGYPGRVLTGTEYIVERHQDGMIWVNGNQWYEWRFKPVVRVKAPCIRTGQAFDLLVQRAVAAFEAMTPEQQVAHWGAQRESWVRGEMAFDEQPARCRSQSELEWI